MVHGSLFSGIGGFDLAAEWMGWENAFHCEWNEFGQRVLKHYWPKAVSYGDITKTDFSRWNGTVDVISGGFPCQPYSQAGKRLGKEDERHLWPEMLRAIREVSPRWVVGENVRGLVNWNGGLVFEEVQADLEAEGYEIQPFLLPACAVNAPHRRDRIWFCAFRDTTNTDSAPTKYAIQTGRDVPASSLRKKGNAANTAERKRKEPQQRDTTGMGREWQQVPGDSFGDFPSQSPICSGNDGLSGELDGITFSKWRNASIKAYGNAVVPQVVHQIFKAIQEYETTTSRPTDGLPPT